MQNHRPARSKRKRVRMRWTAPYTSIPHINGPAGAAGPSVITGGSLSGPCRLAGLPDDRPVRAAEEASVGRHPVAADRAFARRHPAADPGADCPAAVGSASAGSGCSCTSPACWWFPQTAQLLTRGTAESCDGTRPIARAKLAPTSAPISSKFHRGLKSGSHPLVSTIVVNERRTAGSDAHRFDRAEEYVVAADRSDLDDAAVKCDHGRGEDGTARRQRQPISVRKSIAARNPGATGKDVGDLRSAVSQRVDAKYAVFHHDRIGLAAAIEAHEQRGRRVRNRTNRGCRGAGLTAGTSGGDDVHGRAEPAHRFAKDRGLDRAHGLGPHRREGAVHRIIGPLIDPAHWVYSAARLTPERPG